MAIRRAEREDIDAVAEAASTAWRWAYQGIVSGEMMERQAPEALAGRIREHWDPERLMLVSTNESGRVVGFAQALAPPPLNGYDAEISSLYVHADHARGGHGRMLVAAMVKEFLRRGHRSLCIHTLKANRIGRSFYEKHGGTVGHEDDWRGLPAVWYVWPDIAVLVDAEILPNRKPKL